MMYKTFHFVMLRFLKRKTVSHNVVFNIFLGNENLFSWKVNSHSHQVLQVLDESWYCLVLEHTYFSM